MTRKILLVEDEKAIREMLRYALETQDYLVLEADCASQAREVMEVSKPDLLIVDWMMPEESGVEFIKRLRKDEIFGNLPVIMLTARVQESDKVKGLDGGADDYLTKPVAIKELLARIKALLRRTATVEDELLSAKDIVINLSTHQITIDCQQVQIGQTEYRLLKFFMEKQNRVYSRSQLLDFVWGRAAYLEERTVDVHMLRLRKILKPFGKDTLITTVRGMGYMFVTQDDNSGTKIKLAE
jgi:two-component system phosphate regulon response regulator PhoB